uniref:Uncharacterized protein n=1 Tax=Erpetoichthys calabaricus TaxID=27687 RepID=A0A8C4T4X0_ERPCA
VLTASNETAPSQLAAQLCPSKLLPLDDPSVIGGCLVLFLIIFFKVREKRRLEGTHRPRDEEREGTQKQPPSNLKLPPEECVI